ncbi:S-adenosylmethionine synthase [Clostridia bacterium]|nr:S-adenosylmethionine synthase [Clostridia bacterium]
MRYYTAESVRAGHPDKLCDIIADTILDECLRADSHSRVACEVMATKGRIIVAGEITCAKDIDIPSAVKYVLSMHGYDSDAFIIESAIHQQSADIAAGVNLSLEARTGEAGMGDPFGMIGAGDQGTMYGYATDETTLFLPTPYVLARRIARQLDVYGRGRFIDGLMPDGKAQVTVSCDDDQSVTIESVIISAQHGSIVSQKRLREDIIKAIAPCFEDFPPPKDDVVLINPAGDFIEGGPAADTGLTGRKLMCDTYGGLALHGGGALSGKDPTKVDRTGAYMARHITKAIVMAKLAHRCEVALSYAIGKACPVAVDVTTFGTGTVPDDNLRQAILSVFDLRPAAVIDHFHLRKFDYAKTAEYGHFTCHDYPWERVDETTMSALWRCV